MQSHLGRHTESEQHPSPQQSRSSSIAVDERVDLNEGTYQISGKAREAHSPLGGREGGPLELNFRNLPTDTGEKTMHRLWRGLVRLTGNACNLNIDRQARHLIILLTEVPSVI